MGHRPGVRVEQVQIELKERLFKMNFKAVTCVLALLFAAANARYIGAGASGQCNEIQFFPKCSSGGSGGGGASATQSYGVYNADQLKASRENFFEKQQEKNAARPDHLPPSQGGKYAGFGNQAYTPPAK